MHLHFGTPEGLPARERFEFWRTWYSRAVDVPMCLDPLGPLPQSFDASADVLTASEADLIELHSGPARGRWTRQAVEPAHRLRLVLLAPTPGGTGYWHGRQVSLDRGGVALLGRTDGWWRAPHGLRGMQVNLPRAAFDVTEPDLQRINDPALLLHDPVLTTLVRPLLTSAQGHLDRLDAADPVEFTRIWTSLVRMLLRSLAGRDLDGVETRAARRLQAERYIRAHLADPHLSPDTIAAALHVSRRSLYDCLPGVAAIIREARLARAHQLLAEPVMPVSRVAELVGLPDPAHFSRVFRAQYGYRPRDVHPHL